MVCDHDLICRVTAHSAREIGTEIQDLTACLMVWHRICLEITIPATIARRPVGNVPSCAIVTALERWSGKSAEMGRASQPASTAWVDGNIWTEKQ